MEYTKEIFVKDYFEIHNFYSNIYGDKKTIIVMQVGSFHECYSTDIDGLNLVLVAEQLDVICTKKNGKEIISKSNPKMLGFPIYVTDTYIEKLCNLNYTVVKIDQTTEAPKPKREVVGIYSPGTYMGKETNKSNNIISIVIEKNNLLCFGLSAYDFTTGNGSFYETYSKPNDMMLGLDETQRYLESYQPKEIILCHNLEENDEINGMKLKDILIYLDLDEKIIFDYNKYSKKNVKVAFQKLLFEKIFKNTANIFEFLNLELYNLARLSLINLLQYVENHQSNLIEKLKIPKQYENEKILFLGNNALKQLCVFTKNTNEKSLFNIINYTKTPMGKRFLEEALTKPLINSDEINKRLKLIEYIISNNNYSSIINFLEDINDLEKLNRKLEMNILNPLELNKIYISFYQIEKLIEYLEKNNLNELFENDTNKKNKINILLEYINNTFYLDKIATINFNNYTDSENSFIKPNIYYEIDLLQEKIISSKNFMNNLVSVLDNLIDDKKIFLKKTDKETTTINMKFNERDGHYLLLTTRRCNILQVKLANMTELTVGSIILNIKDLEFVPLPKSSSTKINCKKLQTLSSELVDYKNQLGKLLKEKFKEQQNYILENFSDVINFWAIKIGFIDFIVSGSISAINNKYTKPIIIDDYKQSYFKATELRHPIIEVIVTDINYKTQNIELGGPCDLDGIILYGINSSGKSTLMKSIGLNVILAQIGYYTASSNFELSPYKSIHTRIDSNDNIYKSLSSFMVEMSDITSILKRNTCNSLILADELCARTENKSANIIVAYLLKSLSETRATFITATHLHSIANLPCVKKLQNVKAKHLKLSYDEINDKIIYDRILSDGQGECFYGLQISRFLMKDKKYNEETAEILLEYENINIKKSRYNSSNYVIECEICKSTQQLETHHIKFQKDFDKFTNIQKNNNGNLVNLCEKCHNDIHSNKLIINGWDDTSDGRELNYEYNDNIIIKKGKYSDEIITFIESLKEECDEKLARIKIKEKFNIRISTNTIKNIWY